MASDAEALKEVMKHAVSGHQMISGYNTFCGEPEHAIHILAEHGFNLNYNSEAVEGFFTLDTYGEGEEMVSEGSPVA